MVEDRPVRFHQSSFFYGCHQPKLIETPDIVAVHYYSGYFYICVTGILVNMNTSQDDFSETKYKCSKYPCLKVYETHSQSTFEAPQKHWPSPKGYI